MNDDMDNAGGAADSGADASAYPHTKATREDWVHAALDVLISDGVEQVKVLTLARRLDVSRGSFYWYFSSRQDLLDTLLDHWRATNTAAIVEHAGRPAETIVRAVINVFECWTDERLFDPRLDFAVREWSRRSEDVRRVVDQADDARVRAIRDMFSRHGYGPTDAFIRARVLYFMQIGYYALDLQEPMDQRASYVGAYLHAFTGVEPTADDLAAFGEILARVTAG